MLFIFKGLGWALYVEIRILSWPGYHGEAVVVADHRTSKLCDTIGRRMKDVEKVQVEVDGSDLARAA